MYICIIVLSQPVHRTATYRCNDIRCCLIKFRPSDDEHMCSKHVEAWNKTCCKIRICALRWLITNIILRCTVSKTSKPENSLDYVEKHFFTTPTTSLYQLPHTHILSEIRPFNHLPPYLFMICFAIMLPSTLKFTITLFTITLFTKPYLQNPIYNNPIYKTLFTITLFTITLFKITLFTKPYSQ